MNAPAEGAAPSHAARRRLAWIFAAALALLLTGPAGPGRAGPAPACTGSVTTNLDVGVTVWQPSKDASGTDARQCTPAAGSTVAGSWALWVDAGSVDFLRSFTVSIVPADGSIPALPDTATVARTYGPPLLAGSKLQDSIKTTWDTNRATPYNGEYRISATAVSALGSQATAMVSGVRVNNPPAQPAGLAVRLEGTVPVLTWAANPEPDLSGYTVLRSTGGSFSPVGAAPSNGFRDVNAPAGQPLTYEIVAKRRSPADPAGISSSPSNPSTPVTPARADIQATNLPAPAGPPSIKVPGAAAVGGAAPAPAPEDTFAATLPFTQPAPQQTPAPFPTMNAQSLGAAQGFAPSTSAQKLRYLAAAAFLLIVSLFIIRFAHRLRRG
jgi:hypothetical protein